MAGSAICDQFAVIPLNPHPLQTQHQEPSGRHDGNTLDAGGGGHMDDQQPDLNSGKYAPEDLFDDRMGEPGAKIPKATDVTWRAVITMLSLAALLFLAIFAAHNEPRLSPTVNLSKAARVPSDAAAPSGASDKDELVRCSDPRYAREKC